MTLPLPFADQYECRNESLEVYASDRRGTVEYKFNNLGYRNCIDYLPTAQHVGVFVGSSITAGIGLNWTKSFAALVGRDLQTPVYHFAQGCTPVDNNEIVRMLQQVIHSELAIDYVVVQFIDLDRNYNPLTGQTDVSKDSKTASDSFRETFDLTCEILRNHQWCFIGCDRSQCALPDYIAQHPNLVAWNTPYIDKAGVGDHPGEKWHKMMAMAIGRYLKQTAQPVIAH